MQFGFFALSLSSWCVRACRLVLFELPNLLEYFVFSAVNWWCLVHLLLDNAIISRVEFLFFELIYFYNLNLFSCMFFLHSYLRTCMTVESDFGLFSLPGTASAILLNIADILFQVSCSREYTYFLYFNFNCIKVMSKYTPGINQ